MVLNEDLRFDQLPASVRNSFNGLVAKHERIKPDTLLYKFTDWNVFNAYTDKNGLSHESTSAFWGTIDDLLDVLHYCQETGKTLPDCIRQRNAVLHNWNGLNSLLVIRISQDVYGFTGNIGPQTEKGYARSGKVYTRPFTAPIAFWGGASQVYLPGLQRSHITEVVPAETVLLRDNTAAIVDFLTSLVLI